MIELLKFVIAILMVFTALGLVCAVVVGRRRPTPVDPYLSPFGDMPGFTREQLERIARLPVPPHHSDGVALRSDAGAGRPSVLSGDAGAGNSLRRRRRAF